MSTLLNSHQLVLIWVNPHTDLSLPTMKNMNHIALGRGIRINPNYVSKHYTISKEATGSSTPSEDPKTVDNCRLWNVNTGSKDPPPHP